MKTVIVYYSMSGNTRFVAEKIAAKLGADIVEISPEKAFPDKGFGKFFWGGKSAVMGDKPKLMPYKLDLSDYDRVILGTPVWASSFTPPLRTFIDENRSALQEKSIAVFACSSGGSAEKTIEKLRKFICIENFEAELFLVDPKDKPDDGNAAKIAEFCQKLK